MDAEKHHPEDGCGCTRLKATGTMSGIEGIGEPPLNHSEYGSNSSCTCDILLLNILVPEEHYISDTRSYQEKTCS